MLLLLLSSSAARADAEAVLAASPPPAAHKGEGMVAVRLGALVPEPFSSLGASWMVGVEAGWVAPAWRHRIGVVADLGFSMPGADGQLTSGQAASAVSWHASVREVTLGVAVELRLPIGRVMPYLRLGPRLEVVDALVGGHSGDARLPTTREDSVALGLQLVPGVGLQVGPGQLFVEVPVAFLWRVGGTPRLTGDFNPSTLAVAAGYRIFF